MFPYAGAHLFYFSCALGHGIHLRTYGATLITPGLYTFYLLLIEAITNPHAGKLREFVFVEWLIWDAHSSILHELMEGSAIRRITILAGQKLPKLLH